MGKGALIFPHNRRDKMERVFVNQNERYGEQVESTIGDYRDLNPTGEFEIRQNNDGDFIIVEKLSNGEIEIVAIAK
jgi:hypothetical protein